MGIIITARRLLGANGIVEYPLIHVEDGHIRGIHSRENSEIPANVSAVKSFPEAILVPAYIDIHVHGAAGHDVMEANPEALRTIETFLALHGVCGFFPTIATSSVDAILRSLETLADEIERGPSASYEGAVPLGIHLEGPFLSMVKRGAHPAAHIEQPSIALFERLWQAARGHIRLTTIAPEHPNAVDLIDYASAKGVRCSLGHSNATFEEADAGFRAGARSATHTFNAMRGLHHRDPGVAAYVLDNDDLFAEIVCDGIHVRPEMIRLFFKAKGQKRSILVTDGAGTMGMPDGRYTIRGRQVEVRDGRCDFYGALAGSTCPMDLAVRNFAKFTRSSLSIGVRLATLNPARLMGLEERWGSLGVGREANILALSPTGYIQQVFRAGRPVC